MVCMLAVGWAGVRPLHVSLSEASSSYYDYPTIILRLSEPHVPGEVEDRSGLR